METSMTSSFTANYFFARLKMDGFQINRTAAPFPLAASNS